MKNLHECLQNASYADIMYSSAEQYTSECRRPKRSRSRCAQSFILDSELKIELDSICRGNHATASSFLRECTKQLVSEYLNIKPDSEEWISRYGSPEGLDATEK